MKCKFYDTCALLEQAGNLFLSEDYNLIISSITLEELENIKTSANKDANIKHAARQVLHFLNDFLKGIKIVIYSDIYGEKMLKDNISLTNDAKIIACARHYASINPEDEIIFVTNDLCCKTIAALYFTVESVNEDDYDYDGYKEVFLNESEMSDFYSNYTENKFNLFPNEYLLVYSYETGECVDRLCWTGEEYRHLDYDVFKSRWFGDIKPMKGDNYQMLLADSFANNQITMVGGPAGTGKTFLSLAYLMHLLEKHKIDRIIVFCNTVATKNSAKLGFYPGTRDEKLLDSQIGNLLTSKLGSRVAVE